MPEIVRRTCHLCEACCGVEVHVEGEKIRAVRPDDADPRSRGYVCPKGVAMAAVHDDPDRLRTPVRRTPAGDFEPIAWEEALALAARRFRDIRARHGNDAVALYIGNPIVHNSSAVLVRAGLLKAFGSRN
ncbi:MAG TPA: molybdopterin-dependent oxidoreductase, partial [Myxococcota bacterium]|nr:molybdopterin-dependent oxidoreductase [Myxococcota bacterium]